MLHGPKQATRRGGRQGANPADIAGAALAATSQLAGALARIPFLVARLVPLRPNTQHTHGKGYPKKKKREGREGRRAPEVELRRTETPAQQVSHPPPGLFQV